MRQPATAVDPHEVRAHRITTDGCVPPLHLDKEGLALDLDGTVYLFDHAFAVSPDDSERLRDEDASGLKNPIERIVPDGVLFGSSKAHQAIRKELVEKQKLDAVISMPQGVFRPYAGVATGVLFFTKTNAGGTDHVWFYDMEADGFSLDDKRTELDHSKHGEDNLPDIVQRWTRRGDKSSPERNRSNSEQSFLVNKKDIVAADYHLSINRYREVAHAAVKHESPGAILSDLVRIEDEIRDGIAELEALLK